MCSTSTDTSQADVCSQEELSVALFLFQFRGLVDLDTTLDHSLVAPTLTSCQQQLRGLWWCQTPAMGTQELNRSTESAKHCPGFCPLSFQQTVSSSRENPWGKAFPLWLCLTLSLEQISVWECSRHVLSMTAHSILLDYTRKACDMISIENTGESERLWKYCVWIFHMWQERKQNNFSKASLQVVILGNSSVDFEAHGLR